MDGDNVGHVVPDAEPQEVKSSNPFEKKYEPKPPERREEQYEANREGSFEDGDRAKQELYPEDRFGTSRTEGPEERYGASRTEGHDERYEAVRTESSEERYEAGRAEHREEMAGMDESDYLEDEPSTEWMPEPEHENHGLQFEGRQEPEKTAPETVKRRRKRRRRKKKQARKLSQKLNSQETPEKQTEEGTEYRAAARERQEATSQTDSSEQYIKTSQTQRQDTTEGTPFGSDVAQKLTSRENVSEHYLVDSLKSTGKRNEREMPERERLRMEETAPEVLNFTVGKSLRDTEFDDEETPETESERRVSARKRNLAKRNRATVVGMGAETVSSKRKVPEIKVHEPEAEDEITEGESIFRRVYLLSGIRVPIKRLWISSMEDSAILEGFANLKDGREYENLYQSAECRAMADWLVGMNATRAYTTVYYKRLVVGRVQTPTLALLVDRQEKIDGFVKTPYYKVSLTGGGLTVTSEDISAEADADELVNLCQGKNAEVAEVKRARNGADEVIVPFKNLINDAYCRDISTKIRSQLDVKRRRGDFIGNYAPYGYQKDGHNHNHLVVDEYAAGIVEDIFQWKIDGLSAKRIAERLNTMGVLAPSEYKRLDGESYRSGFKSGEIAKWQAIQVLRILTNEIYLGTMIQGKRQKVNYKVKKVVDAPEEQWIRVEETHDAIVSKSTFETVQEILKLDTRSPGGKEEVSLFSGLVECGCCGANMVRHVNTKNGKKYVYIHCTNHRNEQDGIQHSISERKLEEVVLKALQTRIAEICDLELKIKELEKLPRNQRKAQAATEQIAMLQKEQDKYVMLRRQVYEDMSAGIVSREDYLDFNRTFTQKIDAAKNAQQEVRRQQEMLLWKMYLFMKTGAY